MRRGDLLRVALPGDYGKPRPAVIIQSDIYWRLPSITVLPITSDLRHVPDIRVTVEPDSLNGLKVRSHVMIDKVHTVASSKAGPSFGTLADHDLAAVNEALALFFGLTSTSPSSS